jgi:nucleotide-binding universal stress UspA family protein
MFKKILVGFDGSKTAWEALRYGLALARDDGASVWALAVEEPHVEHRPDLLKPLVHAG